ncbi:MAG: FKBP-type peptidyl-prolyl cis-trans isomerase [Acidimicrobiales bacterium]|jgi:peptidylprolyl isomerase
MGTAKRERKKAARQARIEAALTAQRRAEARRRVLFVVGLVAFVAVVIGVLTLLNRDDGDQTATANATLPDATDATSSTLAAQTESALGKPCVPLADPLPAGAPDVPIEPGAPPTELVIKDLVEGQGDAVPEGATVTAHYIGVSCSTGKIFDSSWSRGSPSPFPLSGVIQGWQKGIPGMKPGGRRLLVIPPDLGYGSTGSPPAIAPDETLYFVVDLVSFEPPR